MNRPVLLLRLARDRLGRIDCAPDLAAAAAAAAAGPAARLVTAGPVGTVPEWAATLARSRPAAVLLIEDDSTREVSAQLRAELAALGIDATRAEPASRTRLAHRDGPRTDLTARSELARLYRSGAVPAARAAELGVPVTDGTLDELRHLADRAVAPMTVPLIGAPDTDWRALAERLRRRAAPDPPRIRLRPRVRAELIDPATAEAVALIADGGAAVECDPATGPERLRSALSSLAAHGIEPEVRVRADEWSAETLARLLAAVPDARVETDLATLRDLSAQGALNGCPPQTRTAVELREDRRRAWAGLERAAAGRYAPLPVTAGAHDLWWEHAEPAEAHAAWLGSVVSAGGTVWAAGPAASAVAHVAVRDLAAITAPARYTDADTDRPALAWIETAEAPLADVDDAWNHGKLHSRLFDPGRFIAGRCRLGHGPCPAASGHQLHVGADGAVRAGRGGPVIGKVGDDLAALRAATRALPASGNGCRCRPEGMAAPDRPWLGRVLDAAAAVAELGDEHRDLFEPAARTRLRASGCGGPLTHAHGSADRWPGGTALLRHGDRHYLRSPERIARLTPSLAAVVELRLDRPADAAGLLARTHRLPEADAARAVAAAETALASAGVPSTGEVST